MTIALPGPPSNTGQESMDDLEQTKVYLDVLKRLIEENFGDLSALIDALVTPSVTPAGYVKATGSGFTNQAVPIPVADGGTGRTTLTSGSYLVGAGTGAVNFQAPPIPAGHIAQGTPASGKYPDGGTDPATWTDLPVAGALDKTGTPVTVANNAAEASIYSFSVPGGTIDANGMLRLTIHGFYSVPANLASNIIFRVKYGATTVVTYTATIYTGTAGAAGSNVPFSLHIRLFNLAATNSQIGFLQFWGGLGRAEAVNATSATVAGAVATSATLQQGVGEARGTSAEDSTAAKTLEVTVDWNVASVTRTLTKHHAILEAL